MTEPTTIDRIPIWDRTAWRRAARIVGLLGFFAVGLLYVMSGLLAPIPAVVVLWLIWIGLLVLLIRSWRERPWLVLVLPILAYGVWVGLLLLGQWLFGWSA